MCFLNTVLPLQPRFALVFLRSYFASISDGLIKRLKNKYHTFWSILLVLLCVAIILGPVISIIAALFKEIGNFASYLGNQLNDLPTFLLTLQNEILKALKFLPDSIYTSVSENITQFFGNLINDFDVSKLGINMSSITSTLTSGISGYTALLKYSVNNHRRRYRHYCLYSVYKGLQKGCQVY